MNSLNHSYKKINYKSHNLSTNRAKINKTRLDRPKCEPATKKSPKKRSKWSMDHIRLYVWSPASGDHTWTFKERNNGARLSPSYNDMNATRVRLGYTGWCQISINRDANLHQTSAKICSYYLVLGIVDGWRLGDFWGCFL